jgi:hypothetical protein
MKGSWRRSRSACPEQRTTQTRRPPATEEARGPAGTNTASSSSSPWRERMGQVGNGEYTGEARRKKGGKGRLAHREVVGMVGETGDDHGGRISPASREEEVNDWEA